MRKLIAILGLISLMAGSIVSGTLAMYTTSIDRLAESSVTAKEFIFTSEGTDSFQQGVKLAPSETAKWQFKVKNYDDTLITETDLYYKLTFHVAATPGKNAIAPLVVSVKDASGTVLKSVHRRRHVRCYRVIPAVSNRSGNGVCGRNPLAFRRRA